MRVRPPGGVSRAAASGAGGDVARVRGAPGAAPGGPSLRRGRGRGRAVRAGPGPGAPDAGVLLLRGPPGPAFPGRLQNEELHHLLQRPTVPGHLLLPPETQPQRPLRGLLPLPLALRPGAQLPALRGPAGGLHAPAGLGPRAPAAVLLRRRGRPGRALRARAPAAPGRQRPPLPPGARACGRRGPGALRAGLRAERLLRVPARRGRTLARALAGPPPRPHHGPGPAAARRAALSRSPPLAQPRSAAHAHPESAPAECACAAEVHRGPGPPGAVRGAAASGAATARRGGVAAPSAPSARLGPRASGLGRPPLRASLARDAADAGPEARGRGGSSARARAAPAPPPPSAARGAGAPWARRGSRAAGASDIAPGVRASIHVLWLSSVRVRPADLCFRRHIPSGLDYSEAPLEAAASRSAASPAGDGPGGAHAAAAVAAVAPRLPAPRCRLPGRLPLLQRHGGVRRPAAARRPARYPTRDADAVPAGQQHRAPGPGSPGASRRPAPPLPAQQQPARPGARRLPRAVPPAGAGAHREPAARPASRRLLGPGSAACALPGGDCRSCTCRTTALSCWRTKPWRGSPHWRCWTSAGTTWAPSAARPSGPWPACRSCASQRTLGAATAPCTGWEPGSRRAASGCSAPGTRRSCAPSPRAWRCRASWTFPAAASSASRPRCTWSRSRRRPTWARTCGWPARLRATRSPWSPGERWRSRATGSRGRRRRRRAGRRAPAARAAPTRAAACCSSATSPWPTPASTSARPPTPAAPPACPSSSWSTCPGRSRRSPRRRRPRPPGPSATSRCRRRAAWPSAPWAWPRRRPWRPPSRCWRSRRCCWPP